ncbi:MAG: DUF3179 domain-containing protein [Planctomycetes bacterium]|nr:DUF3179 domain-containing protein [Planctomycetota bacterium]
MARRLFLTGFVVTALSLSENALAQEDLPFNPRKLMTPRRAIVDAKFLKAGEVKDEVVGNELVLGVVVNGKARAYPINMLTGPSREIVNDQLGGSAIAATW